MSWRSNSWIPRLPSDLNSCQIDVYGIFGNGVLISRMNSSKVWEEEEMGYQQLYVASFSSKTTGLAFLSQEIRKGCCLYYVFLLTSNRMK